MNAKPYLTGAAFGVLLVACATAPDHFYTLNVSPDVDRATFTTPRMHVRLSVTVPPLVDRTEMVIATSRNKILILDHELWAGPLSDQVSQILARDLEQRRSDVLVGDGEFAQDALQAVTIKVDIVQMSAERGARAILEAHWRIVNARAATDAVGGAVFESALDDGDYAAVAQAYSSALGKLADRVVALLPGTSGSAGKHDVGLR